jgi:hypothetical protein
MTAIIEARSADAHVGWGSLGGEKWSHYRYIGKAELTRFADLSNWRVGVAIN